MGASSDLRIYVAVTSPYSWNWGVTKCKAQSKEREREPMDQAQTTRYVIEVLFDTEKGAGAKFP